jgi:hypothetical protein
MAAMPVNSVLDELCSNPIGPPLDRALAVPSPHGRQVAVGDGRDMPRRRRDPAALESRVLGDQRDGRRGDAGRASCLQSARTVRRSLGRRPVHAARRIFSSRGRVVRARSLGGAPLGRSRSVPKSAAGATDRAAAALARTSNGIGRRAVSYRDKVAGSTPIRSASCSWVHPALRRRSRKR